jgi:hypothetical protein
MARQQAQHRGMQRVVQVRHRVVGPVDRQRVLDQVVGADRQEVEACAGTSAASAPPPGISIIAPSRHRAVGEAARRPAGRAKSISASVWRSRWRARASGSACSPCRARGAQDRAQLREEHLRLGQAPADRAQAERRVQVRARGAARWPSSSGLSAPTSSVRIVTGRPSMPSTARGRPRTARPRRAGAARFMNRNSLRNRPTPDRAGLERAGASRQLDVGQQLDFAGRPA